MSLIYHLGIEFVQYCPIAVALHFILGVKSFIREEVHFLCVRDCNDSNS